MSLVKHADWWWPESDWAARQVMHEAAIRDIPLMLDFIEGRDLIVQAGGNVGVFPVHLAAHFDKVLTFEPDPQNYEALCKNIFDRRLNNVLAEPSALGEHFGWGDVIEVEKANCGAHRIAPGHGSTRIVTIDSLELEACDAIWLDIEGFELMALKGAVNTIEEFSPMIAVEDKGLSAAYGYAQGDIGQWLEQKFEFKQYGRIGRDTVYRR